MGVYIKDMEMPTRCADCWLVDCEEKWCCACRGKRIESDYWYGIKDRPDWCPLVEVPAHGRLVDSDAFSEEMKKRQDAAWECRGDAKDEMTAARADAVLSFLCEVKLTLDKLPTVIPKEGDRA